MSLLLPDKNTVEEFARSGGGKATHLAKIHRSGVKVPPWFCLATQAFDEYVASHDLEKKLRVEVDLAKASQRIAELFERERLPEALLKEIENQISVDNLQDTFLAVRSSGIGEDSVEHSFAGQFSSFLFQKGISQIEESIRRCWASGFSERALSYRKEKNLPMTGIRVGVVIQKMIHSDSAGVAFSRNPIHPLDRESLVVSSVWGQGEGLVSGELDADHFVVSREGKVIEKNIVPKTHRLVQNYQGGLMKESVNTDFQNQASLSDDQLLKIAELSLLLEKQMGLPQDCEWALERGEIFCLQTRPITNLPPNNVFDPVVNGRSPILWDNSNIVESYSGVTSPLTFSFASSAYRQVYIQFCEVMGVPIEVIRSNESMYRNMLGTLRGRIYYNLINWYRLLLLLPGAGENKGFMETMMGVKQGLSPEVSKLFEELENRPKYSTAKKLWVTGLTVWRFLRIDRIVGDFHAHFKSIYEGTRKKDFSALSLPELNHLYQYLDDEVLRKWHAPIINDYLCMIFFGLLKKLCTNWLQFEKGSPEASSIQNDLLCGQGDLESTEPTKCLMRIASFIDEGPQDFRAWYLNEKSDVIWANLSGDRPKSPEVAGKFLEFLDRFGFRCINELKLEEKDLHSDPSFVINAVASYVRMKSYSIVAMEKREIEIRERSEAVVMKQLSGPRRWAFFWILKQARKSVRNRENLRFARTKIFGVVRHIFQAIGDKFFKLDRLENPNDIFYLTVEEIFSTIEGRAVSLKTNQLARERRLEYIEFDKTLPPPDRLVTYGAASISANYGNLLEDADLLRKEIKESDDPNVLVGTPCCPGVIEGVVRVVRDIKDAEGLNGEILVTSRTDPGWVPLYPSCSGLLIERGSLLSHSAVVARELGLPTVVGISGGLMTKLKTGQKVRVDAGRGEVRILS